MSSSLVLQLHVYMLVNIGTTLNTFSFPLIYKVPFGGKHHSTRNSSTHIHMAPPSTSNICTKIHPFWYHLTYTAPQHGRPVEWFMMHNSWSIVPHTPTTIGSVSPYPAISSTITYTSATSNSKLSTPQCSSVTCVPTK